MLHATGDISTFEQWRSVARRLIRSDVPPGDVAWSSESGLFASGDPVSTDAAESSSYRVPHSFMAAARRVSYARDAGKWALLYRILHRLTHGEPNLMHIAVDDDVHRLYQLDKSVRRDAHKMKAFARFRRVAGVNGDHYIAWHRPDHLIVPMVAPFFADRFSTMRWTIFTPDASAAWDGKNLHFGAGVPQSAGPSGDALEDYWKTYYAAIFNPARIKLRAMKRELPVRHWATLPETDAIDQMLQEAPTRVETMIKLGRSKPADAKPFVPIIRELPVLAQSSRSCKGCSLHCNATQTVFGEGPADAICMFIGEQPGDQEDLAGKPFVGPAGQVLNEVLIEVGIPRESLYVTNAVKHFKFEPRGTRRIHAKPNAREMAACRPWLEAEIETIRPKLIVCLGATAAQSLLGAGFRLHQHRGTTMTDTRWAPWLLATIHPSYLLRIPDVALKERTRIEFIEDLRKTAQTISTLRDIAPPVPNV